MKNFMMKLSNVMLGCVILFGLTTRNAMAQQGPRTRRPHVAIENKTSVPLMIQEMRVFVVDTKDTTEWKLLKSSFTWKTIKELSADESFILTWPNGCRVLTREQTPRTLSLTIPQRGPMMIYTITETINTDATKTLNANLTRATEQ